MPKSNHIITLSNGVKANLATGEIISSENDSTKLLSIRGILNFFNIVFSYIFITVLFIFRVIVFVWHAIGYIVVFGGLIFLPIFIIFTLYNNGLISAIFFGIVGFIGWGILVSVASLLGMFKIND